MMRIKWLLFILLLSAPSGAKAQTINAKSCSSTDVQTALNSASAGDTVTVPAGTCSWSGLSLNKAISLQGAGIGTTNITVTGNNTITKQAAGIIRMANFSFSISGSGTTNVGFTVGGSWKNGQPIVIQNNAFSVSNSSLFVINVAGGVIVSHNTFTGGWNDSFLHIYDVKDSEGSWTTADTIGNRDTKGTLNHYIEDNTFTGGTNQGTDVDDAGRVVYRHNTFTDSSFNTHGKDSSPVGVRHYEIYNNRFYNTGAQSNDCSAIANQNWAIWLRGGTGVIYNNYFDNLAGSCWGTKPEIKLSIRGAEDDRPQGTCGQVSHPVPRQLGQNYNGSSYFTDPIYFWGNTGTGNESDGWAWNNPCGFTWSTFFQWGRDAINQSITGGTAKPGYTAYTYPHPLATGSVGTGTPTNPTVLRAIVH